MNVFIACEFSATVRDAFRKRGHNAWSCDLLPCEGDEKWHLVGDALDCIANSPFGEPWDLLIAHPPCTYLSTVGNKWFKTQPDRQQKRQDALAFFLALYNAPIEKVCIENPQGHVNTAFRKPDQTIHPYYFGEPFHKRTCLWLRGLPKLEYQLFDGLFSQRTSVDEPNFEHFDKNGRGKRWCEMLVKVPLSERWKARSKSFQSIANAMAEQWG